MRIDILTIFPELFGPFLETSLLGRAREGGLLEVEVHDLRHFTKDRHRAVDDEAYGGGGGMVMTAQPWLDACARIGAGAEPWKILLSPQGRRLDDRKVRELAARPQLMLMCGRYEAVDERVIDQVVDEEISIGDYVLSGGELPAMVLVESLSRQIPGVVGLPDSVVLDSFRDGLLDHPHYTRPRVVDDAAVPEVLLSGDHAAIQRWRRKQALRATLEKRPDLLQHRPLDLAEETLLKEIRAEDRRELGVTNNEET
jgi:tRNA (guanine37-N1)-methyltransferase